MYNTLPNQGMPKKMKRASEGQPEGEVDGPDDSLCADVSEEEDAAAGKVKYRCGFPGCQKKYASTDGACQKLETQYVCRD